MIFFFLCVKCILRQSANIIHRNCFLKGPIQIALALIKLLLRVHHFLILLVLKPHSRGTRVEVDFEGR